MFFIMPVAPISAQLPKPSYGYRNERAPSVPVGNTNLPAARLTRFLGLNKCLFAAARLPAAGGVRRHHRRCLVHERPLVTLQAAPVAAPPSGATAGSNSGTIEVTVTAHATSLTTDHEMLVQVIGLLPDPATMSEPPPPAEVTPSPAPSQAIPYAAADLCESNHTYSQGTSLDPAKGKVLLWDRFGPKADGSVDATWKIQVPAGTYSYVCAWAPIGGNISADDLYANSAAYLRLK